MLPRMSTAFVATETIARPVETVWGILTDWDRAPDWMPGVEEAHADGATLRFRARGKERTSRISALDPGRSITLTSVQGGVRADYLYTIAPAGEGTRTTLTADCECTGLWRVAAPALRRLIRRTDGGQLTALKRLIEST
jgi:uncharacterized protein YndB with AHSA1/START domain